MTILDKQVKARLKGRTAWITGGKRVGQTIAQALAEQGCNIAMSYFRSKKEAESTVAMARKLGVKACAVSMDASSKDGAFQAVRDILQTFPRIHILVNMASVFGSVEFENISHLDWDSNYQAHMLGSFWPLQAAAPHMPRGSHVINVADRTSVGKTYRNYLPYIVTKAAVEALTRTEAKELGDRGIFVNAIAPGPVLKPADISQKEWDALRKKSPVQFPINDQEAIEQFALLAIYLSTVTMSSGRTYSLDQGQSL